MFVKKDPWGNHYFKYTGTENFVRDAATWLLNESGYKFVFLFGFSAGGVVVANEIQRDHANLFSAAMVASAPVNWDNYPGIFQSADTSYEVEVCTSFIEPIDDAYDFYDQMLAYYNNMVVHKEWHTWIGGHSPFPNTCADHPGETVSDAAYNWYQHRHSLEVLAKEDGNYLETGDVYIDSQWVGFTGSTFPELGTREVRVDDFWEPENTENRYGFTQWEDGPVDNPRNITVTSDTTITARFYKKWCPGDVDGDCDINDIIFVNIHLGSTRGEPNWDSRADCVYDGVIDIFDVVEVSKHFGQDYPDP